MRWSIRLILVGILVILAGFIPFALAGVTIPSLEVAASFFATGILIFLLGIMLRRLQKTFSTTP